jgi:hypothetical protein
MLARVARLGLETLAETPPVFLKTRPKRLDLLKRYAPSEGIVQVFFSMFMYPVILQLG